MLGSLLFVASRSLLNVLFLLSLRKVKMDQRKLMDNANTITDMAKVCSRHSVILSLLLIEIWLQLQLQNNVYELVSDINARQALMDEKVLTLEERLLIISEQIEQMPDLIKKTLLSGTQRSSLPTLVENISVANQNIQVPSYIMPSYQKMGDESLQQAKHTYLHPNDAACLSARPSWSATNISNPSASGSNPSYSNAKQYLTPNVLRTSSFDTWTDTSDFARFFNCLSEGTSLHLILPWVASAASLSNWIPVVECTVRCECLVGVRTAYARDVHSDESASSARISSARATSDLVATHRWVSWPTPPCT